MERKGLFLVFEGGEGSGKTTQAKLLAEALEKLDLKVLLTKEPGGDEGMCRDIRRILLNPDYKGGFSDRAELLLFEADRAQHVDKIIKPALAEGKIAISDRYEAATYAYQCVARGVCNASQYEDLNNLATGGLKPDFVFWIDIDPALGLQRNKDAQKRDRFEMEDVSFHEKVRAGYAEYFEALAHREKWRKLSGSQPIDSLHQQVFTALMESNLLEIKR